VQAVTVTPGELLAHADVIHYTMGASEKHEEEAIRKAVDFSTAQPISFFLFNQATAAFSSSSAS
jgi:hypothetical protein